jgi:hypothetical protein
VKLFKILQDPRSSKTNVSVSNCVEEEKRKNESSFFFFGKKAKKTEYNSSSTVEDLPLLLRSAILEVNDPILWSLRSFEKSCIIASAYCVFVIGRGLDRAALYTIICAMNGCTPEDLASAVAL